MAGQRPIEHHSIFRTLCARKEDILWRFVKRYPLISGAKNGHPKWINDHKISLADFSAFTGALQKKNWFCRDINKPRQSGRDCQKVKSVKAGEELMLAPSLARVYYVNVEKSKTRAI